MSRYQKFFNIVFFTLLTCFSGSSGADGSINENRNNDSKMKIIKEFEKRLRLPEGARALHEYDRYYEFPKRKEGKIFGIFIYRGGPGSMSILADGQAPSVQDGGCDVIRVLLTLKKKIVSISCGGAG